MKLVTTARALALSSMIAVGALALPAHSADGDLMSEYRVFMLKMAGKDGRVAKKDFLDFMAKKFDEMDKARAGSLTPAEIMRIFGRDGAG